jgi:hypothetical protein
VTEHSIENLPRWARAEITRLRADLAAYTARLNAGPADSDTFADPFSKARRPLGRGTNIEFVLDSDSPWQAGVPSEIRCRIDVGHDGVPFLDVNGNGSIEVRPRASNAIEIRAIQR